MGLDAGTVERLATRGRTIELAAGDVLVAQHDADDDVFCVRSGRLVATTATPVGDVDIAVVGPGQVAGEAMVTMGGGRAMTLRAGEATTVVAVPRVAFESWLAEQDGQDGHDDLGARIAEQTRERIDRSQVAHALARVIDTSDPRLIEHVIERIEWRRLAAGELLFAQGDESDAAYFVVRGRLLVILESGASETKVRELGRDEVVGELGLLDRAPRSASVRAMRDTTLARFSTVTFEHLVAEYPSLMLHVTRGILARLRRPPGRLVDRAESVGVVVTAPIEPAPIVERMLAEIGRHGTVTHLSSDRIDRFLARPGISQASADDVASPRVSELISDADVATDHVLLVADREVTDWTRRAVRHADRVVLVTSPSPGDDELRRLDAICQVLAGCEHVVRMLAVAHPPGAHRPAGTAALASRLRADHVVHLRDRSDADVARLARLASGHGIGLVLSGGGARGFAHLGVFRALDDAGVPVDHVGGCSMGAPIGAALALGIPLDVIEPVVSGQFRRLLDYTIPVVSLLRGRRITRNIESTFGTADLEDLWLPFYCVSTNLTTTRLEVHRRGPAAKFIRASVAIPGVLPPVPHNGHLLVDGGVLDNLPVEAMLEDGTIGTVIAVDVGSVQDARAASDYGMSVSGWRALRATFGKAASPYPGVSSVLLRSMLTGSVRARERVVAAGLADLLLDVDLPGVGLLEFDRVRPVAQAGYDRAFPLIREWAASRPWLAGSARPTVA